MFLVVFVAMGVFAGCLKGYKRTGGLKVDLRCITHFRNRCLECTKSYGYYVDEYKSITACREHENKAPFEYKTNIDECQACSDIHMR